MKRSTRSSNSPTNEPPNASGQTETRKNTIIIIDCTKPYSIAHGYLIVRGVGERLSWDFRGSRIRENSNWSGSPGSRRKG